MRGNPRIELALVLGLGLLMLLPLHRLGANRTVMPEITAPPPAADRDLDVWLDLRFSHPPEKVELFHEGVLFATGGGDIRWDVDATLPRTDEILPLTLRVAWPADLENAYTELAVEPEGRERLTRGFWSRGTAERVLEFPW